MFVSKMKTVAVLVLALTMIFCGLGAFAYHRLAAEVEGKKDDKERLQGTWTEVEVERAGKREKKAKERAKQLVFHGDKLIIKEKGKEFEGSFKLDPKQNPKTIDITVKDPEMVQQGIYRLEEDTLTVSFNKKERPSEFNSAGNPITVFKREAPKK